MKLKIFLNLILLCCTISLSSQCVPTTIEAIDATTCIPANDGMIEFCGLTPNAMFTTNVTRSGITTLYTFSTDATGCGEVTDLVTGSYNIEDLTETATGCEAMLDEMVTILSPPLPPTPVITSFDPSLCGASDGGFTFCGLEPNTAYNVRLILPDGSGPTPTFTTDASGCGTVTGYPSGNYSVNDVQQNSTACTNNFPDVTFTLVDPPLAYDPPVGTDPTNCNPGDDGSIEFCGLSANEMYSVNITSLGTTTLYNFTTDAAGFGEVLNLPNGIFLIEDLVQTSTGCTGTVGTTVTLLLPPAPPTPTITSFNPSVCGALDGGFILCGLEPNTGYSVSATGMGLTTTSPDIFTDASGCAILTGFGYGSGTYTIEKIVRLENSCTNNFPDVTFTLVDPPLAYDPPVGTNPTNCNPGDDGSIEFCGLSPNQMYSVNITRLGTTTLYNFTTDAAGCGEVLNLPNGIFLIEDLLETSTGCTETVGTTVTLLLPPAPPTPTISSFNPSVCGALDGGFIFCDLEPNTTYIAIITGPNVTNIQPAIFTDGSGCGTVTGFGYGSGTFTVDRIISLVDQCTNNFPNVTFTLIDPPLAYDPPVAIDATNCNPATDGMIQFCGLTPNAMFTTNLTRFGITTLYNFMTDATGCGEVTDLITGFYDVEDLTETATGCTATVNEMVSILTPPAPPTPSITSFDPSVCGLLDGGFILCGLEPNTGYSVGISGTNVTNTSPDIFTDASGCGTLTGFGYGGGTYNIEKIIKLATSCTNNFPDVTIILTDPPLVYDPPVGTDPTNCNPGDDGSIEFCGLSANEMYSVNITRLGTTTLYNFTTDAGQS